MEFDFERFIQGFSNSFREELVFKRCLFGLQVFLLRIRSYILIDYWKWKLKLLCDFIIY